MNALEILFAGCVAGTRNHKVRRTHSSGKGFLPSVSLESERSRIAIGIGVGNARRCVRIVIFIIVSCANSYCSEDGQVYVPNQINFVSARVNNCFLLPLFVIYYSTSAMIRLRVSSHLYSTFFIACDPIEGDKHPRTLVMRAVILGISNGKYDK